MNIIERFDLAFKTPLGDLLLFLVIAFITLFFFYLYFWFKFKWRNDLLLFYRNYFKNMQKRLKSLSFLGDPQATLFGKKQLVKLPNGGYGRSTIYYPLLCNSATRKRFCDYQEKLLQSEENYFPKNMYKTDEDLISCVETQYFLQNGKSLINFSNYCLDKSLSTQEKELFLMDIAYMLEALHSIKLETGESLYHGFLLPTSFYLSMNLVKKITHVYICNHGFAFSLGPKLFYTWTQSLIEKKYKIDSHVLEDLERFFFILAPEQRKKDSLSLVGARSDFYSFAALAVFVFSKEIFNKKEDINWGLIPSSWQSFLNDCLEEDVTKRPSNFLELTEYLSDDPEISMQYDEGFYMQDGENFPRQEVIRSKTNVINKKQLNPTKEFPQQWHIGYQAIKDKDWVLAHKTFNEIMKQDEEIFSAHLGLALTYFHEGDQEKAKYHYGQAKRVDEKKIGCFHRLIAFDL